MYLHTPSGLSHWAVLLQKWQDNDVLLHSMKLKSYSEILKIQCEQICLSFSSIDNIFESVEGILLNVMFYLQGNTCLISGKYQQLPSAPWNTRLKRIWKTLCCFLHSTENNVDIYSIWMNVKLWVSVLNSFLYCCHEQHKCWVWVSIKCKYWNAYLMHKLKGLSIKKSSGFILTDRRHWQCSTSSCSPIWPSSFHQLTCPRHRRKTPTARPHSSQIWYKSLKQQWNLMLKDC